MKSQEAETRAMIRNRFYSGYPKVYKIQKHKKKLAKSPIVNTNYKQKYQLILLQYFLLPVKNSI